MFVINKKPWRYSITPYYTAHLRRKYEFGGIIPLRSNPSSANIKESMYAADFARHAPKLGLLPKLELFPKPKLFWKVTLFARYLFHPFIFNFRFNQSPATFTRTDAR
jgi:hypothetical protein